MFVAIGASLTSRNIKFLLKPFGISLQRQWKGINDKKVEIIYLSCIALYLPAEKEENLDVRFDAPCACNIFYTFVIVLNQLSFQLFVRRSWKVLLRSQWDNIHSENEQYLCNLYNSACTHLAIYSSLKPIYSKSED